MDEKTVRIQVIAEAGWKYNGETRELGSEWEIPEDALPRLQKFIDSGDIELVIETRAIDAKRQSEIASTVAKECMAEFRKDNAKSIQVRELYEDDPKFQSKGGFNSLSHFCKEIHRRDTNKGQSDVLRKWEASDEAKAATGMGESISSDGGALVPTAFRNQLLMNALEDSIVFGKGQFIPMATNAIEVPSVDVTSHATNFFGGVLAYWGDEGTAPTASKPKFGKVKLSLNSLKALAYVTDELMEDSVVSLEGLLPSMFSQALTYQMDEKFLTGNGGGCPLGVLNGPSTVSVAKETGQAATTIVTENILKMFARCYPPSQGNAVWIANIDTFVQLSSLILPVGTGGSTVGILKEQVAQGSTINTLLGRPIIFTEKVPTLGTVGDPYCVTL